MRLHEFFHLINAEPTPVCTNAPRTNSSTGARSLIFDVFKFDDGVVSQNCYTFVFVVGFYPRGGAHFVHEERQ